MNTYYTCTCTCIYIICTCTCACLCPLPHRPCTIWCSYQRWMRRRYSRSVWSTGTVWPQTYTAKTHSPVPILPCCLVSKTSLLGGSSTSQSSQRSDIASCLLYMYMCTSVHANARVHVYMYMYIHVDVHCTCIIPVYR